MASVEEVEAAARAMCIQGGFNPNAIMANDGPRWKYYVPGATAALAAAEKVRDQAVPTPMSADQAALMVLLGTNWLQGHAPERLRPDQFREGWIAARDAAADEIDCGCPERDAALAATTRVARWGACQKGADCCAILARAIRAMEPPK